MKRRSLAVLQRAVETATDRHEKARALYQLGVFHDNNSREAQAVPHYRAALRLGLDREYEAMARAWLASSLFKTGHSQEALAECRRARSLIKPGKLAAFIARLEAKLGRI